ncbi:unknown protein [Simkania negevensis Z]|uniref:Uncharacterized protein n=1 Tax=Simkania negevensis (strain ATCC VR-1471 / DSM 27360 / Z) TaxID=331113 RepID=F8L590_SIMNZ|nr:unknown protein [Simkania negevensis Z]
MFLLAILRDFSLSSQTFCLEKDHLALPFAKNADNLKELSLENKQNPEFKVLRRFDGSF